MKRGLTFILCLSLILVLSLSLISAGWFSDFFGRITGNVVEGECIDSDSGDDIYTKGYRINNNSNYADYGIISWDYCIYNPEISGSGSIISDRDREVFSCEGEDCYVMEYHCKSSLSDAHKGYICPNGCNDGACIPEINITCTDSDGGNNIYVKGTASGYGLLVGEIISETDQCQTNGDIAEAVCSENGPGVNFINCPNGCNDGACIPEINITCTDSDGGINYPEKGTCLDSSGELVDGCIVGGLHDGWLREIFCKEGKCVMHDYECPDGCLEGICVNEPEINLIISIATLNDSYIVGEQIKLTDPPESGIKDVEKGITGFVVSDIQDEETYVLNKVGGDGINVLTKGGFEPEPTNFKGYIIELKDDPILVKKNKLDKKAKENEDNLFFQAVAVLLPKALEPVLPSNVQDKLESEIAKIKNNKENFKREVLRDLGKNNFITGNVIGSSELVFLGEYENVFNGIALEVTRQEAEKLKKVSGVKKIHPNYEVKTLLMDSVPLINADDVWELDEDGSDCSVSGKDCLTGKGVTIGIIDTGVDYTHEDLGGCFGVGCKVVGGYDFVNWDNDPLDDHGHGTHCVGIASGNGILKGVAPDAKIYAYKVLDEQGSGSSALVILGIEKAVLDGVDVISLSLGGYGDPDDPQSQAIDNAVSAGVVAVVAAGNSGPGEQTIGSPGTARKAITVGASDDFDNMASFSSRGPVIWEDDEGNEKAIIKPDVVAPGVDICAAQYDSAWDDRKCFDNEHIAISGTSMATPHVAGAVALLKQKNPDWSPDEIKMALRNTGVDLDERIIKQGQGRVDILKAVQSGRPLVAELAPINYEPSVLMDIYGTSKGEGFSSYELFYGEEGTINWDLICSGSQIIEKGILCKDFDALNLVDGRYEIKLVVYDSGGEQSIDFGIFKVDNLEIIEPFNNGVYRAGDLVDIKVEIKNLEYGFYSVDIFGEDGVSLGPIGINIIDNSFAIWDTSLLEDGFYSLVLTFEFSGSYFEEYIENIYLSSKLEEGWPIRLNSISLGEDGEINNPGELAPQFYDVDYDGEKEVLFLERTGKQELGKIHAFKKNGLEVSGWPIRIIFEEIQGREWLSDSPITIADIDGDNKDEILVQFVLNDDETMIYGYDFLGNKKYELRIENCNFMENSIIVFDFEGDGKNEIIIQCQESFVIVDDLQQINIPLSPLLGGSAFLPSLAIGNFDDDLDYEIVIVDPQVGKTKVEVYNYDGTTVAGWSREYEYEVCFGVPVVGDIDNDDEDEIIFGGYGGLFVLENDGFLKWYKEGNYGGRITLSDLEDNGQIKILAMKKSLLSLSLRIFNSDGSDYFNWGGSQKGGFSSVTKDITGDGVKEIFTSSHLGVLGYKNDGSLLEGFPLPISEFYHSNILQIEDIDNDGKIEFAASADENLDDLGVDLYLWEIEGEETSSDWSMFQHDLQRTGCYDCGLGAPQPRLQSKIVNTGGEDLLGNLIIKIQKKAEEWQDYLTPVNQEITVPVKGLIKLDIGEDNLGNQIFAGFNNMNVSVNEAGEYRVYVEFLEKSASWEFDVV